MKRFPTIALLLFCAAFIGLAACSSDKDKDKEDKNAYKPKRLCPQTAIVRDLERISDYGAEIPDESALVATALMTEVRGGCDYRDDGVDMSFELKMAAAKKERLGGSRVSFPFFVALVDPDGKVLSKEMMTAGFEFSGENRTADLAEPLHVFIPLEKDADASYYRVLLGFQLTEDQLAAARKADEGPVK